MSSNSSSSNVSVSLFGFSNCLITAGIRFSDTSFNIVRLLLIFPLAVFILYLAYQKWKQQGSLAAASHCDVFTYHLSVMELFTLLGTAILLSGYYSEFKVMVKVGYSLMSVPYCGEAFFHVLTCGERYLAVVHPLTYRGLKTARGIVIRNSIIGCIWVLCFAWMVVNALHYPRMPFYPGLGIMVPWLAVVFFFSLSVLFVLIRSGPGEGGQGKVDKSKQRAFLTIMIILVMLVIWVGVFIIALFVNGSPSYSHHVKCVVMQIAFWINIPSSLVLPLMYLQRSGKLLFCRRADEKR